MLHSVIQNELYCLVLHSLAELNKFNTYRAKIYL